jgi:uncharacterized protein YjlB
VVSGGINFYRIAVTRVSPMMEPVLYLLPENSIFPNSKLPVLHYRKAIDLPLLFPALTLRWIFRRHGWGNNWRSGIFTFHHYHSITHEVLGVVRGKTRLQLGGAEGIVISIEKGDVIVIPAGVAHRNLGKEKDVICVGGYPKGRDYDMNYGLPGERPAADRNIATLPIPLTDPVSGAKQGLPRIWRQLG